LAVVFGGYRVVMAGPLRRRNALIAFLRAFAPGTPGIGRRIAAIPRLVKATFSGRYDGGGRLFRMGLAGVYILSPIDFIPEILFGPIGLVDDAGVAVWLAGAVLSETERFLKWEEANGLTKVIPRGKVVRAVRVKR
jgi:uncharacterized membrane protein YkvA (DUF1232 family)